MFANWNIFFWEYEFLQPFWLILLILIPITIFLNLRKEKSSRGDMKFSGNSKTQNRVELKWISKLRLALLIVQSFGIFMIIIALAKPFKWEVLNSAENEYKNGIDIILSMDVSGSMMATDFLPNRLTVAKEVAKQFVDDRKGDRIGLVVYSQEAYTPCPTTLDHEMLKKQIDEANPSQLGKLTAIGIGLGTAVSRLRDDKLKSKVIILLTDGSNNSGDIDPITAANLAKSKKIRVYTIGVGSNGSAMIPGNPQMGKLSGMYNVEIDEETLKSIAEITGGKYFRATDEDRLKNIYKEIDQLEKRQLISNKYKKSPPATPASFLNVGLLLLLISFLADRFLFKSNE
jgi:Ca-activated chloride channel family protein